MLSRVLKGDDTEFKPFLRHSRTAFPACNGAVAEHENPVKSDEADQLRAKMAELKIAAEKQARQAYESGVRDGEAQVRRQMEDEVRQTVEKLSASIVENAQTRTDTIRRAERDTVRLAIEIARRVLHRELSVDNSALEALIRAALEKLQNQEVYRVRVHPDQEPVLKSCLTQAGRHGSVLVVADPTQPKGGAIFEISRGALDASVETQLREIERGLTDQLEQRE